MRKILLVLCSFAALSGIAQERNLLNELQEVNAQWQRQPDLPARLSATSVDAGNAQTMIRRHLLEVIGLLGSRSTACLTADQRRSRTTLLAALKMYADEGDFPANTEHSNRQPYFIDHRDVFCAVGHLMKVSGAEAMARRIRARSNYAYLHDISDPELAGWVSGSGFTADELALIQPWYNSTALPASITEIHYNNVGADVNEYIEVAQCNVLFANWHFREIRFYNQAGVLYKTVTLQQMQPTSGPSTSQTAEYGFAFSNGDTLANAGRIDLLGIASGSDPAPVISTFTYNGQQITVQTGTNVPAPVGSTGNSRNFSVAENEQTPVGTSLSFCGNYANVWTLSSGSATPGQGTTCIVLPNQEFGLRGFHQQQQIVLQWTSPQQDVRSFTVEHSRDGRSFSTVSPLIPAGPTRFEWIHREPAPVNFYRLKAAKADGSHEYSAILQLKAAGGKGFTLMENPVRNILRPILPGDLSIANKWVLSDVQGKVLAQWPVQSVQSTLTLPQTKPGQYFLTLYYKDGGAVTQQVICE